MFNSLIFLIVCWTVSSSSFDFHWDTDIVKKYAEMRIISDCLGDNFIKSWRLTVKSASEKCHGEIPNKKQEANLMRIFTKKPMDYIFSQVTNHQRPSPFASQQQHNSNYLQQLPPGFKTVLLKPIGNRINSYKQSIPMQHHHQSGHHEYYQMPLLWGHSMNQFPHHRLWKRSTTEKNEKKESTIKRKQTKDFNYSGPNGEELMRTMFMFQAVPKLNLIRKRITHKISNMTCVLQYMELVNKEGLPNYQYNLDLIQRLTVPQSLKENFIEGQEFCKSFSMCVPTEKVSSPLASGIGKSIVFLKCLKKTVLEACMAHDLLHEKAEFLDMFGKSSMQEYLKEDYKYGSQDTIDDLQRILDSDSEFGFGF